MLNFAFTNETDLKIEISEFSNLLEKTYFLLNEKIEVFLKNRIGEVNLILVNDEVIHNINLEHRGKNEPTDVITFAYLEISDFQKQKGDIIVGDIFISVDTAKKQAKEKNHSLKKELGILFIHGLLHCFGFDHKTDEQEKEMEKIATEIFLNA